MQTCALCILKSEEYSLLINKANSLRNCKIDFVNQIEQGIFDHTVYSLVLMEAGMDANDFLAVKNVKEANPLANIVLLMKECCFEFSLRAMRLGVNNILVGKEIDEKNIKAVLADAIDDFSNNPITRTDIDNKYFEKIIYRHDIDSNKTYADYLNLSCGLNVSNKCFVAIAINSLAFDLRRIKQDSIKRKQETDRITKLLLFENNNYKTQYVFYLDDWFYLIVTSSNADCKRSVFYSELLSNIYNRVKSFLGENVTVLCSNSYTDFKYINKCLIEIERMKSIIHIGKYPYLKHYSRISVAYDEERYNKLQEYVARLFKSLDSGDNTLNIINAMFSFENMASISYAQFIKLKEYLYFEFELFRKNNNESLSKNQLYDDAVDELIVNSNYYFLKQTVIRLVDIIESCKKRKYNYLITKSIRYIESNYSEDIGLYDVAKYLDISTVYLSQLFKKETGKNFNSYVTQYRIEQAKMLIDKGDYKLSRISVMVGFKNTQYFSLCFKKVTNMTPNDYKNRK